MHINGKTKLEYYNKSIVIDSNNTLVLSQLTKQIARTMAKMILNGTIDRVPILILNTENQDIINSFIDEFENVPLKTFSKTCQAGILFLKKQLSDLGNLKGL